MEIVPAAGEAERLGTELMILGIFRDGPLTGSARAVNGCSGGRLAALLDQIDLGEEAGAAEFVGPLPGVAARRLLLVGLGRAERFSDRAYRQALAATARALDGDPATDVVVTLAENEVPRRALDWRMRQAGQILAGGRHDFGLPHRRVRKGACRVMLLVPRALTSELVAALRQGVAIGEGVSFAKELGDLPPDLCTPAFIVRMAQDMARQFGFRLDVLERSAYQRPRPAASPAREEAGAGKLIVMRRERRRQAGRPIVLISDDVAARDRAAPGRPVRDMRGIGSVFGAMRAVERLELAVNVVGLVAVSGREGTPCSIGPQASAGALRPEGRNVSLLGDVLAYAAQFSPSCVIDVAGLSRAGMLALGSRASGLFANDEALASELLKCGGISGDRVWQLPLWDADAEPFPERDPEAGPVEDGADEALAAVTSLARSAAYPWAHLDISGTAATIGALRSSTGRPVPLLAEFLIGRARTMPH
jgi:leucyl aminopeptidase